MQAGRRSSVQHRASIIKAFCGRPQLLGFREPQLHILQGPSFTADMGATWTLKRPRGVAGPPVVWGGAGPRLLLRPLISLPLLLLPLPSSASSLPTRRRPAVLEIARFSLHLPSGSGSSAFTILCKCEMGGKRPAAQWDNGCYSSVGGEWRG